ncbi:PTS sugar transporter subunit IIA [Ignavigranum ruoffiae]|uniref:PTS sugar transporter subunit IIA n=1 Tax=Ignavigranum ruoffiae TaxID=89093 RepID=UPI0024ADCF0E|nr:PTS sugar transporter subunit IIA [Ignavigranum ruoffiae]
MEKHKLIEEDLVFISNQTSVDAIFDEISQQLFQAEVVSEDFCQHLKEREANFPTGLDLTPLFGDVLGIAVPHTETQYVRVKKVIPIKLNQVVEIHNMIQPDETLKINFMFMILNDDPSGQADILARIMEGIGQSTKEMIDNINQLQTNQDVYKFAKKILGE